jgi:hypothetical protein
MPTVTVSQPSVIKVRIDGQQSKVKTVNYASKAIKDSTDIDMTGANTGHVLVYNASSQLFSTKPIGSATPVTGSFVPTSTESYDIGTANNRFRSIYLSGNTINMGGMQFKTDANTGSVSFAPAPTNDYPNPIAILVTPTGGFAPIQTVGGEIPTSANIRSIVSNTSTYIQFTGNDAGFF